MRGINNQRQKKVSVTRPILGTAAPRTLTIELSRVHLVYGICFLIAVVFLSSIHFGFLNRFVIGSYHGNVGFDFFPIPRAFDNLIHGRSMYDTWSSNYGPYSTWYPYHPLLPLFAGSWTSQLAPWVSFWCFVVVSLGILVIAAEQLRPLHWAAPLLIFANFPVYLMLWNAQMHIFLNLGIALVLRGVADLESGREQGTSVRILVGLMFSLFSKPMVLALMPILLLHKASRSSVWIALSIYGLVSIAFLTLPWLDPMRDNRAHWMHIVIQGNRIDGNVELFSIPEMLARWTGKKVVPWWTKIPILSAVALGSSLLFPWNRLRNRFERGWVSPSVERMLLAICTILASYYLSYPNIWEYHYTTLFLTFPALLWMSADGNWSPLARKLLVGALITFYLPTPYFLVNRTSAAVYAFVPLFRVLPVALIFVLIFVRQVTVARERARALASR